MAQTLHSEARNNTLNRQRIVQYTRQGVKIDDVDSKGFTALAIASQEGRSSIVRALLYYGADPNKTTNDGRTPLYLAAGSPRFRPETVKELLAAKPPPNVDATTVNVYFETPLMVAVAQSQDPEVIKLLVDAGASTTKKNARGQSAQSLADQSLNPRIRDALAPKDQQGKGGAELANCITNLVLFLLAYFQAWQVLTAAILSCIRALAAITQPKDTSGGRPIIDYPRTLEDYLQNIENILRELGLDDIFSPNDDFCKRLAEKVKELGQDPNRTPDEINDLIKLAFYQPVLFLDDSGSMKGKWWQPQKELTDRMTRIIGLTDVEKTGVHLRFINRDIGEANGLDANGVVTKISEFEPAGSTKLGTQLTTRVLAPMVYTDLQKDALKRPYLIMTVTDGCPNEESENAFVDAVVQCSNEVKRNGYTRSAVRFSVSQIGDDAEASKFLDRVTSNTAIKDILYVTSDRLDAKYEDLKDNEKNLELWLIQTMINAIKMKP